MADSREAVESVVREGDRVGPYRVERVLPSNRGGFAQMAVARHLDGDVEKELVAIKIARVDPGGVSDTDPYARALSNEVETLRQLKHPGIARLYPIQVAERRYSYIARAINLPNNPWYFVMEYLAGGSLEGLIQERQALDLTLAVEIAHQVGEALDYVHTSGYAHLDIKTNNILFRHPLAAGSPPEAVLIDFGAAQKAVRRAEVEAGALVYLAPERVEVLVGRKPPESVVNKSAADVYALGVTLYCMLAGQLPFKGRRDDVTTAILNDPPTHPAEVNRELNNYPELNSLVMQMLEKRPERRPSIKDVLTRLDQVVPPPRMLVDVALPSIPIQRPSSPGGWRFAALAIGAVAILEGVGATMLWQRGQNAQTVQVSPAVTQAATATTMPTALPTQRSATPVAPSPGPSPRPAINTAPAGGLVVSEPQVEATATSAIPSAGGAEPTLVPTHTPRPTNTSTPTATPTPAATP